MTVENVEIDGVSAYMKRAMRRSERGMGFPREI